MAKADRLERMEIRRVELEEEYRLALIDALKATAAGQWGLFDHGQDKNLRARVAPVVDNLTEIGEAIDHMRETLSMPPFDLHREFLAARGKVSSHAVGEPKQAQAWLERLDVPA
jgi:hypothetical protein